MFQRKHVFAVGERICDVLTVIGEAPKTNRNPRWLCKCDHCGSEKSYPGHRLLHGGIRSCGCLRPLPPDMRFWRRVKKGDGCWLWEGAWSKKTGYGSFRVGTKHTDPTNGAHRVAWELQHGSIQKGMEVLHRCDNRLCVRPDHLFLGTQQDNIDDMYAKGRDAFSRRRRNAKAQAQVAEAS